MLSAIVLAAGEGKRMKSRRPKVLQPIGGRPMLHHLIESIGAVGPGQTLVVTGSGADQVEASLAETGCLFARQPERLGTGHAAMQALPLVADDSRVLILPGDMPLIRPETLKSLLASQADLALLSFMADDPTGYGRILRDAQGRVLAIREQRDASADELAVNEVNSGVMCARAGDFARWLDQISDDNAQGEYYLTDCIAIAAGEGRRVDAVVAPDADELMGANDRAQLAQLEAVFQNRARQALMAQGATLADPSRVIVRGHVACGQDVFIDADVLLQGDITLGDDVQIGQGCVLKDCSLASGTQLAPYTVIESASTTGACTVGPFARLRPGTELAEGVKIGNFVETKNARFERGAKASHLSYVGDARVGEGANLGAGTITCNYDGVNKHRTDIGAGAFVGSNSALVAPVEIGQNATIGAGSVISQQAPADTLTVARARQRSLPSWKRPEKKAR
ncbi:MAG: bifunctional UDP-N-acetylglucosamine diphosphorylase/glucosamine-1-phosphate N-acetyltransferase GlmU [Wenzhouxiangella sp.]